MLTNLIYFVNSNGVDTVVKNTLNAVYTLLNVIEPIAKIDLYEIIGLDLSTLTFEKSFSMLLDMIYESTGYRFTFMDVSAVAELSVGTLKSYESKNGKTAYKMVYQSNVAKTETKPAPKKEKTVKDAQGRVYATGKRKTSFTSIYQR